MEVDKKVQEAIEYEWLRLGDVSTIQTGNPLAPLSSLPLEQQPEFMLKLMSNPRYIGFTSKWLYNKTLDPFQIAVFQELWFRPFPMMVATRGFGKSFMLGLCAIHRALFTQGSKIVIVGSGFRQAKFIFDYIVSIWTYAPILKDLCKGAKPSYDQDRYSFRIGESIIYAIPIGTGEKIRGQRATHLYCDEFSSVNKEIYENVIEPFSSVSGDPIEQVRDIARKKALERMGLWSEEHEAEFGHGFIANQSVISGSAYWGFNHFAAYFKRWHAIIHSRGDRKKLEEIFQGEIPPKFRHQDYSIIRMPVELLPEGYMNEKSIAKSKVSLTRSQYLLEYGAIFVSDSDGFFKRSLIESCVVGNPTNLIWHQSCGVANFNASLRGIPNYRYVMAIDPASHKDNLAIIILELWEEHRRIVYAWSTNNKKHKLRLTKGVTSEFNYVTYCARKIRDLKLLFPCERIALDAQGGGLQILESLQDPKQCNPGEQLLLPVVDPENEQFTDRLVGEHIIEVCQFARSEWLSAANHNLKKDLEVKALLFPAYNSAELAFSVEQDRLTGRIKKIEGMDNYEQLYDTLEDAMDEIEELKDELATIEHTEIGAAMRERFSTPEIKQAGGKKGRLKKDRYSALLMANAVARELQKETINVDFDVYGGFAGQIAVDKKTPRVSTWNNPEWYERATPASDNYGFVKKR